MAKVGKVKKREPSDKSRAARRGASPEPKVQAKAPVVESDYKPWLHNAAHAGISKKPKVKQMTRQQRLRHQRGLEKADSVVARLEKKVQDSQARGKKVKTRNPDWEQLNQTLAGKQGKRRGDTADDEISPEAATMEEDAPKGMAIVGEKAVEAPESIDVGSMGEELLQRTRVEPVEAMEKGHDEEDGVL